MNVLDRLDDAQRGRLRRGKAAFVPPILVTLTAEHFSDPDWIFERELDGIRAVVVRDDTCTRLFSRNETPIGGAYPELVEALGSGPRWWPTARSSPSTAPGPASPAYRRASDSPTPTRPVPPASPSTSTCSTSW